MPELIARSCISLIKSFIPVKIRLQCHGKKGKPFYWIIAANSHAKRDGKLPEKLRTYNPISNPAQIEVNVDAAVKWLQNGAQSSDTARRILSYKGVLLKHHLLGGIAKGALTTERAEAKFNAWVEAKNNKVFSKEEKSAREKAAAKAKALDAEKGTNEKRKNGAATKAAEAAAAATTAQAEGEVAAEQPQKTEA